MIVSYIFTVITDSKGLWIAKFSPFIVGIFSLQTDKYTIPLQQTIVGMIWLFILSFACYFVEKNNYNNDSN